MAKKIKQGFMAALEILNGLTSEARAKLLKIMQEKDPQLTKDLRENLYQFEDLIKLSPLMIIELTRSVNTKDLGMALKIAKPELREYILKNTPKMVRDECVSIIAGPMQLTSTIEEAVERIMAIVRTKVEKNELKFKDYDPEV